MSRYNVCEINKYRKLAIAGIRDPIHESKVKTILRNSISANVWQNSVGNE